MRRKEQKWTILSLSTIFIFRRLWTPVDSGTDCTVKRSESVYRLWFHDFGLGFILVPRSDLVSPRYIALFGKLVMIRNGHGWNGRGLKRKNRYGFISPLLFDRSLRIRLGEGSIDVCVQLFRSFFSDEMRAREEICDLDFERFQISIWRLTSKICPSTGNNFQWIIRNGTDRDSL